MPVDRAAALGAGQLVAGKVALVTAAGSGIGAATAALLAVHGARVVVSDIEPESGAATVQRIADSGGDAAFVRADVADEADVRATVSAATKRYGRLDIAFNNAGIGSRGSVQTVEREGWDRVIAINITGTFLCLRHEVEAMIATGGGAIINNASVWGLVAGADSAAYVTSKHAVVGMTKSAALDFAQYNVRVNAVAPGVILTPMMQSHAETPTTRALVARTAMNRWGQAAEVAQAVLWLASDAASLVTGTVLNVDGGFCAS
jgi:NAD(P)-dependent dehydrogenase (short-subunit alcohol dehydrogenase family)